MKPAKVRFCPSPTGLIHLGNTRTALFNKLYAGKHQGEYLLRIEDTDKERSKLEYIKQLQEDLIWLGLLWDEGPGCDAGHGPYFQSERQSFYNRYYADLIHKDRAYPCFCTEEQLALNRKIQRSLGKPPRYPGTCKKLSQDEIEKKLAQGLKPTLRFSVPVGEVIEFNDFVKGPQRFLSDDIGDFIIRRADKTAPFMYCNAIDDALMGVTHIIRGEDHLTNTPRQILIFKALNLNIPQYGHISLIVGADGSPLSKRHGSRSVVELRREGFFPIAVNNYLARLGHAYDSPELMSLEELALHFNEHQLGRAPARFDIQQLHYWQNQAIQQLSWEKLWEWMGIEVHELVPDEKRQRFVETIRPNVTTPEDAFKWAEILFTMNFNFNDDSVNIIKESGKDFFEIAHQAALDGIIEFTALSQTIKERTGKKGKALFQPLRVALTNELHGPEMAQITLILGQDIIVQRLQSALDLF